jgi:hypothetical protein
MSAFRFIFEVKSVGRIKEHGVEYCILSTYLIDSESYGAAAGIDQIFPLCEVCYKFHRRDTVERLQIEDVSLVNIEGVAKRLRTSLPELIGRL